MRRASWKPVIVSSDDALSAIEETNREFELVGPKDSALLLTFANGLQDEALHIGDHVRKGDLRFSVGVALALILPAFLGLGFYAAVHSIILMAS